jgi:hypothetical protein
MRGGRTAHSRIILLVRFRGEPLPPIRIHHIQYRSAIAFQLDSVVSASSRGIDWLTLTSSAEARHRRTTSRVRPIAKPVEA